jgi:hypothetical protein
VTIVARSSRTRDGLQRYLEGSGFGADAEAAADAARVGESSSAVVMFPDDFTSASAIEFVRELRRARPSVLLVLVTREPSIVDRAGLHGEAPAVVLPRPSFGWSIVDVIRAHADGEVT